MKKRRGRGGGQKERGEGGEEGNKRAKRMEKGKIDEKFKCLLHLLGSCHDLLNVDPPALAQALAPLPLKVIVTLTNITYHARAVAEYAYAARCPM